MVREHLYCIPQDVKFPAPYISILTPLFASGISVTLDCSFVEISSWPLFCTSFQLLLIVWR